MDCDVSLVYIIFAIILGYFGYEHRFIVVIYFLFQFIQFIINKQLYPVHLSAKDGYSFGDLFISILKFGYGMLLGMIVNVYFQ